MDITTALLVAKWRLQSASGHGRPIPTVRRYERDLNEFWNVISGAGGRFS